MPGGLQEQLARSEGEERARGITGRPRLAAMERAHYPLQSCSTLLPCTDLRSRLPEYDPDRDLAGVLYLFLRGMTGPSRLAVEGQPCGVFAWRPPAALVEGLSDLLDRGGGAT